MSEIEPGLHADQEAIRQLRHDIAWALDTRDWALFESQFAEQVETDFSELGIPARTMSSGELTEIFRFSFRRETMRTQQLYSNFRIDLAGNGARCVSYLHGHHFAPGLDGGETFDIHAIYEDEVTKTGAKWRIVGTRLRLVSMTGNLSMIG